MRIAIFHAVGSSCQVDFVVTCSTLAALYWGDDDASPLFVPLQGEFEGQMLSYEQLLRVAGRA